MRNPPGQIWSIAISDIALQNYLSLNSLSKASSHARSNILRGILLKLCRFNHVQTDVGLYALITASSFHTTLFPYVSIILLSLISEDL